MLGLGLKLNYLTGSDFKGILDDLNIAGDLKLGFADVRLTKNYDGIAYTLVRASDDAEQDFYFDANGELPVANMISWLGGSNGLVKRRGNQGKESNYAYQNTKSLMPVLISGGSLQSNGMLFDGIDDKLIIDKYSEIDLTTPRLTLYGNFKRNQDYINQTIFTVYETTGGYGLFATSGNWGNLTLGSSASGYLQLNTGGAVNKVMGVWEGYNSNEVKYLLDSNTHTGTKGVSILSQNYVAIGARPTSPTTFDRHFDGNIKTVLLFDSNQESNFDNFKNAGL